MLSGAVGLFGVIRGLWETVSLTRGSLSVPGTSSNANGVLLASAPRFGESSVGLNAIGNSGRTFVFRGKGKLCFTQ